MINKAGIFIPALLKINKERRNNMLKNKRLRTILIYIIIVMASMFLIGFYTAKNVYASTQGSAGYAWHLYNNSESAYDVLVNLGFDDAIARDEYEYHLLVKQISGWFIHYYSNEPISIFYKQTYNTHALHITDCYADIYNPLGMYLAYQGVQINDSTSDNYAKILYLFKSQYNKVDLLTYDYLPTGNVSDDKCSVYYVSGSEGVVVKNNSMADIGYPQGSVFFFPGNYTNGNDEQPVTPPDNPENTSLSDDDKSWLGSLFDGITQGISDAFDNVTSSISSTFNNVVTSVSDAFSAVGEFILNGIREIFIPDEEYIEQKVNAVKEKFGFIEDIKTIWSNITDMITNGQEEVPQIVVDLSDAESKYNYGGQVVVLDMAWYAKYKPTVDKYIIAFSYITFIFYVYKRLPDIIRGVGAETEKKDG